jgi:hypothetical protein
LARRGCLTGSRLGKIITPKTGKLSAQARSVIADLIAEPVDPDGGSFSTYWTDRGILMEEEARSWYEFDQGVEVRQVGLVLSGRRLGFSPDGLIGDDGMVEFKVPKPSTHVRYLMDGGLPDEYKAQVHGGLIICDRDWCDFVSYSRDFRPLVVRVEPDDFTEKLRGVIDDFLETLSEVEREILRTED